MSEDAAHRPIFTLPAGLRPERNTYVSWGIGGKLRLFRVGTDGTFTEAREFREEDNPVTSRITELLLTEQEHLWTDLNLQLRMAANEHWSLGVENKIKRILWIADEVGVVSWKKVSYPILSSGIYQAVCRKLGQTAPRFPDDVYKQAYNPMWDKTVEYIDVMRDWEWK